MFVAIDATLPEHPKLLRLCSILKNDLAGWYLVRLWRWAMQYAKDGDLSKFETDEIEAACGWRGGPGRLLGALATCRFIDLSPMKIHDWMEENGKWAAKAEADRRRKAEQRMARVHGNSTGRPPDAAPDVRGTSDGLPRDGAGTSPSLPLPSHPNPSHPNPSPSGGSRVSDNGSDGPGPRSVAKIPRLAEKTADFLRVEKAHPRPGPSGKAAPIFHDKAAVHGGPAILADKILAALEWQVPMWRARGDIDKVRYLEAYIADEWWTEPPPAARPSRGPEEAPPMTPEERARMSRAYDKLRAEALAAVSPKS